MNASSSEAIDHLVATLKTIAVLGIKTDAQRHLPAYYVAKYLQDAGFNVVPVPVYYPDVRSILNVPVFRRLIDVPTDIDLVDVFRRPKDIDGHVEDILAKGPRAVWFQSGIRNDAAAERFMAAGIAVVQDRCLMVEHRRFVAARRVAALGR